MVEAHGMCLVFLPVYSPNFNPIEEAFSVIKAWIRANQVYVRGELPGKITCDPYTMIWSAVFKSVTLDKVEGWFHDCGYL
jgi:lantibiotic modifying enzyme